MIDRSFVTAGEAIFTVANPEGDHYTYRVDHKEASSEWPEAWFISLLTGPDNISDYTYLGKLNVATGAVQLTKKSAYTDGSLPVKVIRWALRRVWADDDMPDGYEVHHEGRCGRCGRTLTAPSSIDRGIGPVCARYDADV